MGRLSLAVEKSGTARSSNIEKTSLVSRQNVTWYPGKLLYLLSC
jgi:hypothetical protein